MWRLSAFTNFNEDTPQAKFRGPAEAALLINSKNIPCALGKHRVHGDEEHLALPCMRLQRG